VDIHPAAKLGRGVLMDHATGVVIGETAIVGDNVSMLHHVTLGGSGNGLGQRHPTIGNGALLGAGSTILGPVTVGQCSKIGAGSVVVTDIPPHTVAVGVPARVVKVLDEPLTHMDAGVEVRCRPACAAGAAQQRLAAQRLAGGPRRVRPAHRSPPPAPAPAPAVHYRLRHLARWRFSILLAASFECCSCCSVGS
jgi:acyl-[acyl carrier protein]--UDP-N-acetylglucosamine O-acyltransferase